ncbi:high frequency lysogenization protein HflD [Thorsellia anophelis]|uniref:High frequency lysogenization protein HflD homolog n=1 Tax=Thorsellia anophelis DSM 18579 TaxID=1123402 RepID=A0A1I0BRL9_9GAMM|nr:high frequency lysogenization protein HflD [Thorsellia anophelis]SET09604.1 high frequency lysogenization protein [Thorsellia anophelis DSM 18579]
MSKNYSNNIIALAGLCQAATLVRDLSQTGQASEHYQTALIDSLLQNNPETALDVYGGDLDNIRLGLKSVNYLLNMDKSPAVFDITRYALSMLVLERRLMRSTDSQNTLRLRMASLTNNMNVIEDNHEQLIYKIAGIYADVISPLGQRVQVTGSEQILTNTLVQAKIRTLLLSGIRAAILWRQVGGNRWQFVFARKKMIDTAESLLNYVE